MALKTVPGGTTTSKSTRGVDAGCSVFTSSDSGSVYTDLEGSLINPGFPVRDGDSSIGEPVNLLQVRQMGRVPV